MKQFLKSATTAVLAILSYFAVTSWMFVIFTVAFMPLFAKAADSSQIGNIEKTANAFIDYTRTTGITLDVMSARDAKSDSRVQALRGRTAVDLNSESPATALYYKGTCLVFVNTRTVNHEISLELQKVMSKEDLLFFITVHEVAHCISHHNQALELQALASGKSLTNTFLPKEVITEGDAGTLTQASFQKILNSEKTMQREEAFADVMATLYTRVNKSNADNILKGIISSREVTVANGDHVHDTVSFVQSAISQTESITSDNIVTLGHQLITK